MMISSPNIVGFRTSTAASRMICSRLRPCWSCASCLTQFSTITTELSTTSPKSMAPRLKRLAAMPNCSIPEKAQSIESGMAKATISPARRFPRKMKRTAMTKQAALKEILLDRVDHVVDQLRAVIDGLNLNAGGQRLFDFFELILQRPGDFVAVFAHQHEAQAEHRFAASIGRDRSAANLVSNLDIRHVADANRHAVA